MSRRKICAYLLMMALLVTNTISIRWNDGIPTVEKNTNVIKASASTTTAASGGALITPEPTPEADSTTTASGGALITPEPTPEAGTGNLMVDDVSNPNGLVFISIPEGAPADGQIHLLTYEIYDETGALAGILEHRAGEGTRTSMWATVNGITEEVYLGYDTNLNPVINKDFWNNYFPEDDYTVYGQYTYKIVEQKAITEKIATPQNVAWDSSKAPGWIIWDAVEGAGGYHVTLYKDSSTVAGWITQPDDDTTLNVADKINESGIYTIRISAYGNKTTLDSDESEHLAEYVYTRPVEEIATPTKVWWTTAEGSGIPTIANWTPVVGAKGYVTNIEAYDAADPDGARQDYIGFTTYNTGDTLLSYRDFAWQINVMDARADVAGKTYIYRVTVQALSGNIELLANSLTANFKSSGEYQSIDSIEAEIQDELTQGDISAVIANRGIEDVADAMASNQGVCGEVASLEAQYMTENAITVADTVVNGTFDIAVDSMAVVGAGMNVESGEVGLVVETPVSEINVNEELYHNVTQVDMSLAQNGVAISELEVPMVITMPAPEYIGPDRLVILHEHNGEVNLIYPEYNAADDTITFSVTEFSTFAFAGITLYDENGKEDKEYSKPEIIPTPTPTATPTPLPTATPTPEVSVMPSFVDAPTLDIGKVSVNGEETGYVVVSYTLNKEEQDISAIDWYRVSADGFEKVKVATSRRDIPEYAYIITPGDVGYYIMAEVTPKTLNSESGIMQVVTIDRVITAEDLPRQNISTDFQNFPTEVQNEVKPGFWIVEGFKPLDAVEDDWEAQSGEAWTYGLGINGAADKYGLIQTVQGSRILYTPVEGDYGDMSVMLQVAPCKAAGQGFGSDGHYMDILIKMDTENLNGYALRIERTNKSKIAVDFTLMKYTDGVAVAITEPVTASCYNTLCTIELEAKGNTLTAHVETTKEQSSKQEAAGLIHEVDLTAEIVAGKFGGVGVTHTGTGDGNATLLTYLEVFWEEAATPTPLPTATPTPLPTATPTPLPTATPTPEPTATPTPLPTATPTPLPTATPTPEPTPTPTPLPTSTPTPEPTATPTPLPTATPTPLPTATPTPLPTSTPTPLPTIPPYIPPVYIPTATPTPTVTPTPTATPMPTPTPAGYYDAEVSWTAPEVYEEEAKKYDIFIGTSKKDAALGRTIKQGETVDLNFYGVKNWTKDAYTYKWTTSDESIATVNKNGVVTMHDAGIAIIKLELINKVTGEVMNVAPVEVGVPAADYDVFIGTSKKDAELRRTLEIGKKVDLNFYGVKNWKKEDYEYEWYSTDETVATVGKTGVVTAHTAGKVVIRLRLKDLRTGEYLTVAPVVLVIPEVKVVKEKE